MTTEKELWYLAHTDETSMKELQEALCALLKEHVSTVDGEWGTGLLDTIPQEEKDSCGHPHLEWK